MKYLIIDASLSGTGIRDYYEGGYINPEDLGLSSKTVQRIHEWLSRYENEHYNGFEDFKLVDELDNDGRVIAKMIKNELLEAKIWYYSDARLTKEII